MFPTLKSHGTGCAGIIAAVRDNGVCGVGGAYDATITGTLLPSALARGFEWGIYSHDMRMYVRTYVSVTLRNVAVTSRWNVAVSRLRA